MKTYVHLWEYLAQYFFEWEMFLEKNCSENQNTRFTFNNFLPPKSYRLWGNVEKIL
jgi:hypothetical protein